MSENMINEMPKASFVDFGGVVSDVSGHDAASAPEGALRFMVVSGFLGAGKTTTMIALANEFNKRGLTPAIIANDLGANLVDTSITQASGCSVTEIANGCICYQMDNVVDQLRHLRDRDKADFVMSDIPGCGVGALDHVYRTLATEHENEFTLAPFMVVVDPERLRMLMPEHADINLPEELVYLLKLQLEEADLVLLNKCDLLDDADRKRMVSFLEEAVPEVPVMCISAREQTGIALIVDFITTNTSALKNFSVSNQSEFEEAEAKLTWYNRRLFIKTNSGEKIDMNAVIDDMIEEIRMGLIEKKRNVPHLKTFAVAGNGDYNKASLIGVDYDIEYEQEFLRDHKNMRMIVNARATCEARPLSRIMDDALDEVCDRYDLDAQVFFTECFGMADEGR